MSKGLEALKRIGKQTTKDTSFGIDIETNCNKDYKIIEKELKELEERREMMRRFNEACVPMILDNETEKKLKALEIIKENKVNVPSLITLFKSQTSYEDYEQLWDNDIRWQLTKNWDIQFSRKKLTQEEYDLLKEVLL